MLVVLRPEVHVLSSCLYALVGCCKRHPSAKIIASCLKCLGGCKTYSSTKDHSMHLMRY